MIKLVGKLAMVKLAIKEDEGKVEKRRLCKREGERRDPEQAEGTREIDHLASSFSLPLVLRF